MGLRIRAPALRAAADWGECLLLAISSSSSSSVSGSIPANECRVIRTNSRFPFLYSRSRVLARHVGSWTTSWLLRLGRSRSRSPSDSLGEGVCPFSRALRLLLAPSRVWVLLPARFVGLLPSARFSSLPLSSPVSCPLAAGLVSSRSSCCGGSSSSSRRSTSCGASSSLVKGCCSRGCMASLTAAERRDFDVGVSATPVVRGALFPINGPPPLLFPGIVLLVVWAAAGHVLVTFSHALSRAAWAALFSRACLSQLRLRFRSDSTAAADSLPLFLWFFPLSNGPCLARSSFSSPSNGPCLVRGLLSRGNDKK
mmetsp:Transcript_24304/g.68090  ORF Transcript_24304/g.68090 Transcript_24304/m.68090 type:complete len:311 (-) Transcript_24304:1311-2243(-)